MAGQQLPEKQETQRRIAQAARKSFARKAYAEVSVNAIISDAGVSKGSFYWHFSSKKELFLSLLREDVENLRAGRLVRREGDTPFQTARRFGHYLLNRAVTDRNIFLLQLRVRLDVLQGDSELLEIHQEARRIIASDINALFSSEETKERAENITRTLMFFMQSLILNLNVSLSLEESLAFWERIVTLVEKGEVFIGE